MPAIRVENISKRYRLGERVPDSVRELFARFARFGQAPKVNEIWALKDVCFELEEGETLGIIGRNGSGKSTLLKILSRITKPTSGSAIIRGRVGCLLEVGTGFHNELTGRENIYMSGAILGMKKFEIERKFDEIVAFSEIERFLDTPVKHYSSGMYMRLAFSVAAHLEPEILIVDEVLAVGDSAFQSKCIGKMDEVRRSGRTVLFVSHNLGSLAQICRKGVLLHKGEVRAFGSIDDTIADYLQLAGDEPYFLNEDPDTTLDLQIIEAKLTNNDGQAISEISHRDEFFVSLRFHVNKAERGVMFCLALLDKYRGRVFTEYKNIAELTNGNTGFFQAAFRIPGDFIAPNIYSFLIQIVYVDGDIVQELTDVCPVTIVDIGSEYAAYKDSGYVRVKGEWHSTHER